MNKCVIDIMLIDLMKDDDVLKLDLNTILLTTDIKSAIRLTVFKSKGFKTGYIIKDPNQISVARKNFDYIFAKAERKFFERKIDFILNAESSEKKDSFHYRRTSLNHVHAKLARDNNITILFGIYDLTSQNLFREKLIIFGRMLYNSRIVRKYHLKYCVCSMGRSLDDKKTANIRFSIQKVFGL